MIDIYQTLTQAGVDVFVLDPWIDSAGYPDIRFVENETSAQWDAVLLAIRHDVYKAIQFKELKKNGALIFDAQGMVDRLYCDWRW